MLNTFMLVAPDVELVVAVIFTLLFITFVNMQYKSPILGILGMATAIALAIEFIEDRPTAPTVMLVIMVFIGLGFFNVLLGFWGRN